MKKNQSEAKNHSKSNTSEQIAKFERKEVEFVIHAIRVLLKLAIVVALILSKSQHLYLLIVLLLVSELVNQVIFYLSKKKPSLKGRLQYVYIASSITAIAAVAHFANWALNDFYLVFLVHIASSTYIFGFVAGIASSIVSAMAYGLLLFSSQAPIWLYLRLPLLAMIILRLLLDRRRYEKIHQFLIYVLDVEKAKQDFIAIASHNLRTPVAAIRGYLEILTRGDEGDLNKSQLSIANKILSNNQELSKLTEQLLQISILETGEEANLLLQPSQINVVVKDVVDKMMPAAKEKGLKLVFKPKSFLPMVNIDVQKIQAVMSNLVDNAVKYTEKGGVTVKTEKKDDFVIISVVDTGVGIPEKELPKIFNKFYRAGNILIYNKTGVGLGLFLGQRIVDLHGGKITVSSQRGKGSTFNVFLPIIKGEVIK